MFIGLAAMAILIISPILGLDVEIFPVMVVLGPLMVLQYAYWRRRRGKERTTWQYLQAEPTPRWVGLQSGQITTTERPSAATARAPDRPL